MPESDPALRDQVFRAFQRLDDAVADVAHLEARTAGLEGRIHEQDRRIVVLESQQLTTANFISRLIGVGGLLVAVGGLALAFLR